MSFLYNSIAEHAAALRRHEYSSVELTQAYINRIAEVEGSIGAYIFTDAEISLSMAEHADAMLREGCESLLCGIPVAIKDNICTVDFPTTCASKMLEGYYSPFNASAVDYLSECGCVFLGKTNMDEFAMGSGCETSAYKLTKNPYDKERSPGGSSGGSAAAVAVAECVFALGSDTGGSVRQPASLCGVVGMKPTYGAVSRSGLVAFASSLDQIGVISRNVSDNALILSAISKKDPRDATCMGISDPLVSGISDGVKDMTIGVIRELFGDCVNDEVRTAIERSLAVWKNAGAKIIDVSLPSLKYALSSYHVIASAEASSNLARFDGVRFGHRTPDNVSSIDELYIKSRSEGFGDEVKLRLMMGTYVLSEGSRERYYQKAQKARRCIRQEFIQAFDSCSILVSPMTYETAPELFKFKGDPTAMYRSDICGIGASLAGMPAMSVPCGYDSNGLPIGIQLIGADFCESALYRAGAVLERGISL